MSPIDHFTCQQAAERLDDYLDRELSAEEIALVQAHLDTCAMCAEAFAFEARVLDQVRSKLRRIDIPASALEGVLAVVRAHFAGP